MSWMETLNDALAAAPVQGDGHHAWRREALPDILGRCRDGGVAVIGIEVWGILGTEVLAAVPLLEGGTQSFAWSAPLKRTPQSWVQYAALCSEQAAAWLAATQPEAQVAAALQDALFYHLSFMDPPASDPAASRGAAAPPDAGIRGTLNDTIKNELKGIVGPHGFIDDPESLAAYAYDAFVVERTPALVLLPESTAAVSAILAVAHREGIPVTARGAGTSICGATVPAEKGIVLSLTRMDRILDVSTRDRYCIVQPGVVNGDLQARLATEGFFYPPDPGSYMAATIGGNVAQNAGGPRCLKYGVTVDYVLSLEVVLADGEVIRFGSRNVKDVTGYRLSGLFCGSEGTLGVVTEITLRVVPLPEATRTVLAVYSDLDATADTVSDIIGSGILPAALELMDKTVVNAVEDSAAIGLPRHAEGLLLIEVDGVEEAVEKQMRLIVEKARVHGATEVIEARTPAERDALWTARRSAYGVFARLSPDCIVEDATVPVSHVPEMIRRIRDIARRHRLRMGILAHAGDGNMHPLIATDTRDKDEWRRVEAANREIFELAVRFNGTLSGEHGIGLAKRAYLPMALSDGTRAFMSRIKRCVDPKGILNPGKGV